MRDVAQILEAMGLEQCLLSFVFLGSYAFAMGELVDARGRRLAVASALATALCFVAFSDPWEEGVMLVALAFVGMGVFTAAVWFTWRLAMWRVQHVDGRLHGVADGQPSDRSVGSKTITRPPLQHSAATPRRAALPPA